MQCKSLIKKEFKLARKRHHIILPLLVLILLILIMYTYSAQAYAYKYVSSYNNNSWDKVYTYYEYNTLGREFEKNEIIEFLKEQKEVDQVLKLRKIAPINTFIQVQSAYIKSYFSNGYKEQIDIPIEYVLENDRVRTNLTMIKDKESKKWFVKFPYKLENLYIIAPIGASVHINGKQVIGASDGEEIEIKDMLPGSYTIAIQYYNDIYPPFIQNIYVPDVTRIESPHNTCDITVFAPIKTWISLGDIKKYNPNGAVKFNNVLEGDYTAGIFTYDKELEVFTKKVKVEKDINKIYVDKIKTDKEKNQVLNQFFKLFNEEYQKGILNRDVTFLHKYTMEQNRDSIVSDFKMWYVDYKDIQSVSSLMEIRDIYVVSGEELSVSVLEIVYLTNKEEDGQGNVFNQDYRVGIEWKYKISRNNSNWQIVSRDIVQSIVAYKDEEGRWVQY